MFFKVLFLSEIEFASSFKSFSVGEARILAVEKKAYKN